MLRVRFGLITALAILAGALFSPVSAQEVGVVQSEILVLDPDRLFIETSFGQRLNADYLARREEMSASNVALQAELEAEEKALTELRSEKTPEEFSQLADEFDARVQQIRQNRDRAVRELERSRERAPVLFMRAIEPVVLELMRDAGGSVVLDLRTVLFRADLIDITDLAISRVDARIGTGPEVVPGFTLPEPAGTTQDN